MADVFLFPGPRGRDNGGSTGNTGDGSPPGGGDLDTRIINLERDMTDVKVAIGKVETRLESIQSNMVTKGQLAVYALLGLMAVGGGGWWVVQQYLAPILAAIGKLPS
ncbi:hypothetical protein [Pseudomonas knackmussii]|uniref:hypothetical protein n=1 Tax=Pseudomonas knackmussii TaxID=65741 RepID=UPI00191C6ED8|nr:hypothetical protein [Pseudomonas knackmussii]